MSLMTWMHAAQPLQATPAACMEIIRLIRAMQALNNRSTALSGRSLESPYANGHITQPGLNQLGPPCLSISTQPSPANASYHGGAMASICGGLGGMVQGFRSYSTGSKGPGGAGDAGSSGRPKDNTWFFMMVQRRK